MTLSQILTQTRNTLETARKTVDPWFETQEKLLSFRPASQGWTVSEILEHIVLTSKYLLILIEKGAAKSKKNAQERSLIEELKDYELTNERLDAIGQHRAFAWIRPSHMEPTGERKLEDVRDDFHAQIDRCLILLEELKDGQGLLHKTTMSVNGLGKLDVYQYLYFLAQHALRHVQQMEKNQAELADYSS